MDGHGHRRLPVVLPQLTDNGIRPVLGNLVPFRNDEGAGPCQLFQRFPQDPPRQDVAVAERIGPVDEDDVQVPVQLPVLEAVVEEEDLRPEAFDSQTAAGGRLAVERFGTQVLLLDDGFQHWQLYRDLDIVLVDGTNPFGNGHVLPRGILREPLEQLARAGAFIITKRDQISQDRADAIVRQLRQYNRQAPVAMAIHKPSRCLSFAAWHEGRSDGAGELRPDGQPILAVSALGNPASFERTLSDAGFTVTSAIRYEDHHQYSRDDIRQMADQAAAAGCPLVTTEKDAVKLPASLIHEYDLPLYVLSITIEIVEGQETIDTILQAVLEDKL